MCHKIYSPVSTLYERVERAGKMGADKSYAGPLTLIDVFATTQHGPEGVLQNN